MPDTPGGDFEVEPITDELFAKQCSGGRCRSDATRILVGRVKGKPFRSPYCDRCLGNILRACRVPAARVDALMGARRASA